MTDGIKQGHLRSLTPTTRYLPPKLIPGDTREVLEGDWGGPQVPDPVNHPGHYTGHPSGIECITITEHMGFCLGNAIKYIFRCDLKKDAIEDLKKAAWYIQREITKREKNK